MKRKWILKLLILAIIAVLGGLMFPPRVTEVLGANASPRSISEQIEPIQEDVWSNYPLLKKICSSESLGTPDGEPRQYLPDGTVLWGWDHGIIVKRDVGACQINTKAHAGEISLLGLDVVNSESDNIKFAKMLFDREGWKPWIASKGSWDPTGLVQ